jgi:hypothetical protein
MNIFLIIAIFLFVYINTGYFIAAVSWNRFDSFRQSNKFSLINFLLWPTNSLENINRIESNNGLPVIESFSSDTYYKSIVTLIWPLKVIFNTFIIAFISFLFSMMILWRIFVTICFLLINLFTIYKKIYTWDLIKNVWKKPLVIKDF